MTADPVMVFDAGPLIHLSELHIISILEIFKEKCTTSVIINELEKYIKNDLQYVTENFEILDIVDSDISKKMRLISSMYSLDYGEITAISSSLRFTDREVILVSDDSAARMAAESIGLYSVGTIGLIVKAATVGKIKRIDAIHTIESIPVNTTLFIKRALLVDIVKGLKEEWDIQ